MTQGWLAGRGQAFTAALWLALVSCLLVVAGCAQSTGINRELSLAEGSAALGPLRANPTPQDPVAELIRADESRRRHRSGKRRPGQGYYKVGRPYQIQGRWYYPKQDPNYDATGVASWYGPKFHGKTTANGEIFDMNALTAAHPTLPMPSYVYVTNVENGRRLLVRLNDRGPYARNRIIDLSRAVSKLLGFKNDGTVQVRVQYVGRAPLDGNNRREIAFLESQSWYRANPRAFPRIARVGPGGRSLAAVDLNFDASAATGQ